MKKSNGVKGMLVTCLLLALPCVQAQHSLKMALDSLLQGKQARVGVAVVFDEGEAFSYNALYHFPLMSVFKFHQALAVLNYLDVHRLPLDTGIFVRKADLLPDTYSPLRDARPEGNFQISVGELLKYSVSQSDNNVCDILFRYLGGTGVVDRYIRELGETDFKIEATEEEMHKAFEYAYLNWSTPLSAARLMEKFRREPLFKNPVYKEFLEQIMIETVTGRDKLKAGLPQEAVLGHKTGSSDRNGSGLKAGDNDLGFVRLPDGREYVIAVFVMDSKEDDKTNAAMISAISQKVYEYYLSIS
ncbi:class A beta-lactamase, subclass A2 [Bacteroides sp.]